VSEESCRLGASPLPPIALRSWPERGVPVTARVAWLSRPDLLHGGTNPAKANLLHARLTWLPRSWRNWGSVRLHVARACCV